MTLNSRSRTNEDLPPQAPPVVGPPPAGLTSGSIHPYAHPEYARGLAHIGAATGVPEWGTPMLVRPVPAGGEDAMGIYPLTAIARGADLPAGLDRLRSLGLISATLVPDPLSGPSAGDLSAAFDVARPFKTHLTLDRSAGPYAPSPHHRERIRRGHRRCRIEQGSLHTWLADWVRLYAGLVDHRGITGPADFPPAYFEALTLAPAMTAFAAWVDDRIVGLTLWFAHDGVVYNHLTAVDAAGYANGASYALYDSAIAAFEGQGVVNLGGGAGAGDQSGTGGLYAFKRGFANSTATALICGAILDQDRYRQLGGEGPFFPAYRAPVATS